MLLLICVGTGIILILSTILLIVLSVYTPFSTTERLAVSLTHFTFGTDPQKYKLSGLNIPRRLPLLKQSVQTEMLELFVYVLHCLKKSNIRYWLVKSSLLAAVRHGSLMAWDENLSIAVEHKDLAKLVGLRAAVESTGQYTFCSNSTGYSFCKKNFLAFPYVSVFITKVMNNELVSCTPLTELGQCTFNNSHKRRKEIFEVEDVFPLGTTKLNGVEVNVPKNSEKCLDILFGLNWRSNVVRKVKGPPFLCNDWTKRLLRKFTFMN